MPCFSYVPEGLCNGYRKFDLVASPPQCPCHSLLLYRPDIPLQGPIQALIQQIVEQFVHFGDRAVNWKLSVPGEMPDLSYLTGLLKQFRTP